MLEISKQVFDKLNKEGVSYCHFKSNEHLEAGLNGDTDLDILIKVDDRDRTNCFFKELGLKRFEPFKIGEYPGVVNWYGFDKTTGKLIHFHTHYNLITGKGLVKDYYLPWEELMLKTAISDDRTGVKITNPNLEYILLCTRIILKRKFRENLKSKNKVYIDKDIINELSYLKKSIVSDILKEYIIKVYDNKKTETIFQLMLNIENINIKEFKKLNRIIRTYLRKSRRMPGIFATIKSFKNRLKRKINRDINKKLDIFLPLKKRSVDHGLSVAFVGIDGSGKSTVSTAITKWLQKEFDTKRFYAGAGDGKKNILSAILLNTYKKNIDINKKREELKENYTISKKSKLYKFKNLFGAIAYYRILKDNISKIIKINRYCKKGCFCIMDRFPQGQVESEHDGPKVQKYLKDKNFYIVNLLAKKEKKLIYKLENEIPKFDLLFKMKITPETAIKRKPDHSYDDLSKKSKSLDTINFAVKKMITIDASNELEKVIIEVKNYIWDSI